MNRGFESDLSVIRNMLAETKVDSFLAERRGPQHPPVDILALTEDMTIGTALEKMAEKMSSQFAHKGVVFSIRVRLEPSLWGAIPCIGSLYEEKDGYFLVIQQQSGQPC